MADDQLGSIEGQSDRKGSVDRTNERTVLTFSGHLQDLRPQDSLPFLRRISADIHRPALAITTLDSDNTLSLRPEPTHSSDSAKSLSSLGSSTKPHQFVKTTFSKGEHSETASERLCSCLTHRLP